MAETLLLIVAGLVLLNFLPAILFGIFWAVCASGYALHRAGGALIGSPSTLRESLRERSRKSSRPPGSLEIFARVVLLFAAFSAALRMLGL